MKSVISIFASDEFVANLFSYPNAYQYLCLFRHPLTVSPIKICFVVSISTYFIVVCFNLDPTPSVFNLLLVQAILCCGVDDLFFFYFLCFISLNFE